MTPSPSPADDAGDKPRLTAAEKKANHIASEHKRREAIRAGFDQLTQIVPNLEGMARSEGLVLRATKDYIIEQLERRKTLIAELEAKGVYVDPQDKEVLQVLEDWKRRERHRIGMESQQQNVNGTANGNGSSQ
ncbi:hypothetical protein QBC46DRAFT_117148 [Diplogelasinospora grovesii]|uniref:BHLH domain-containing protein n=1 Tax=Diplogelasinospora grovesii TaxID=303347 RepID=A0AAN6S9W6_9PEZI|nr:hypothetical protein QBC46DRAFT_117148 [Diplogelasinospora grovesii]